jgi:alpha-glucosidase
MWMLAVMSARLATTLDLPLSFLGEGAHRATYIRDDKTRADAVQIESASAARGDVLKIDLAAGGGFVGRFLPP